jgi:hypothetical protein
MNLRRYITNGLYDVDKIFYIDINLYDKHDNYICDAVCCIEQSKFLDKYIFKKIIFSNKPKKWNRAYYYNENNVIMILNRYKYKNTGYNYISLLQNTSNITIKRTPSNKKNTLELFLIYYFILYLIIGLFKYIL